MKLRNNSMKDYVPDHYPLGYLMVNYGREKYGLDFWSKVTKDASAFKGLFYPFQKAIKKYSGVSYKVFREDAFDYYRHLTPNSSPSQLISGERGEGKAQSELRNDERIAGQGTINRSGEAGIKNITPLNKKFVTNYYFHHQPGGDSLLYLKTSYRERSAFYIQDAAGE